MMNSLSCQHKRAIQNEVHCICYTKNDITDINIVVRRISTISTASTVSRRKTIRKRDSGDLPRCLTPEEIRAKCIEEILHTEIDYVQHLHDIVEVKKEYVLCNNPS